MFADPRSARFNSLLQSVELARRIAVLMQYRTEIHIASDRYVCLQLPDFIPEGRATVTVSVTVRAESTPAESAVDRESDIHDIEWWDEFDGVDPRIS